MSRILLLDSGLLGLATHPKISSESVAMNRWILDCLHLGDHVVVPAIVYYEIRGEWLRAKKHIGLMRLDAFLTADPNRYLHLTDEALRLAAELWAKTHQEGRPMASALDIGFDVILAAQALTLHSDSQPVVVPTSPRHLQPFVAAQLWLTSRRDRGGTDRFDTIVESHD